LVIAWLSSPIIVMIIFGFNNTTGKFNIRWQGFTLRWYRELLTIPDGVAIAGHISVGYRADPWPKRLRRNPVEQFAFGERYGEPY